MVEEFIVATDKAEFQILVKCGLSVEAILSDVNYDKISYVRTFPLLDNGEVSFDAFIALKFQGFFFGDYIKQRLNSV